MAGCPASVQALGPLLVTMNRATLVPAAPLVVSAFTTRFLLAQACTPVGVGAAAWDVAVAGVEAGAEVVGAVGSVDAAEAEAEAGGVCVAATGLSSELE